MVIDEMSHADSEWTVSTLKSYFEALRREDEKAIVLLQRDLAVRLDRLDMRFTELKEAVDQFHAAYGGREKQDSMAWLRGINIITIIVAILTIIAAVWVKR